MPFLARIIQDDEKLAAYSFIHSMATTLGISIYEQVSVIVAAENSDSCHKGYGVGGVISDRQRGVIDEIVKNLRNGKAKANNKEEIKAVLAAPNQGGTYQKSGDKADFYMRRDDEEFFFEIKTVKPNIDVFEKNKTKLLQWVARKQKPVKTFLAFPYNPYHPEPYERFTEVNMMERGSDFLVGEEYWSLIGNSKTVYNELLNIFDEVGKKFKQKLNDKFKEIAREQIDYKT